MALMREDSSEREDAVDALGESRHLEAVSPLSMALEDADVRGGKSLFLTNQRLTKEIRPKPDY